MTKATTTTVVKTIDIACAVMDSDMLKVNVMSDGSAEVNLSVYFNDEYITKSVTITRTQVLELIKTLSVCMFEDTSTSITENAPTKEMLAIESRVAASMKRAYVYVGVDAIGLNTTSCRELRDELERGLNA